MVWSSSLSYGVSRGSRFPTVFLGVTRRPTVFMGVPRGSWLPYVVRWCSWGSSLSYGVSCGFFVCLHCSYGDPRGFSRSYRDPRFNRGSSFFFGVPLRYSFSYGVLLQCSLLYGVHLGSSLFFFFLLVPLVFSFSTVFFVFLFCPVVFFGILRCYLGFFCVRVSSGFGIPNGSSAFLVIIRCPSGFLVVLGLLRVANLFCGVTRRSGFLPRQLL